MTTQHTPEPGARWAVAHPNSLFAEFLALIVRPAGGWAPVSAIVELMAELGFDEALVRAMVSRQKRRGWLEPEKRGRMRGYRLSELALTNIAESDKIVWHPREEARIEDGWVLVTFSVPESARTRRHLLRSRLGSLGFGAIGPGTLLAPARMEGPMNAVLRQYDLGRFVDVFHASLPSAADPAEVIGRGWDLAELNDAYLDFVEVYRPVAELWAARGTADGGRDAEAFRDYVLAFNRWRRLPLRDPGLPSHLLGAEWAGQDAGRLFEDLVDMLRDRAIGFARGRWAADIP
ncbi:PaaX family transcriptional regulator C-terminal domain-containing protein [Amycolatopsis sp. GM8]|uniref:PaaX family transcriptional regulator n=1 Tax=Amycolatopsis sp. GM8 TaxID=2896530 RepID=UPI001F177EF7|nr:PaaX family transcriptional regulator C-terminal domain-containing protein [Amycolatopsis sp. GM8]